MQYRQVVAVQIELQYSGSGNRPFVFERVIRLAISVRLTNRRNYSAELMVKRGYTCSSNWSINQLLKL